MTDTADYCELTELERSMCFCGKTVAKRNDGIGRRSTSGNQLCGSDESRVRA